MWNSDRGQNNVIDKKSFVLFVLCQNLQVSHYIDWIYLAMERATSGRLDETNITLLY